MSARQYAESLRSLETPFYFYDMDLLRRTLEVVLRESSRYGFQVHYALKANFDDRIVSEMVQAGLGMDCVSGNEVRKAIESGCPASKVVYAGVGKSDKEIRYALEQGIFAFNVESLHELEVINTLAGEMGRKAPVALRINPNVDPRTHRYIATGQSDSKFGISYTEINQAIASLTTLSEVEIVGLHFHVGSQILDMGVFENLCHRVNDIKAWFEEQGIRLRHINLGGGLGVDYYLPDQHPISDFAAYFETVHRSLKVDPDQTVHFELGRSLVAQCGELITRVLYNKQTATGTQIVVVDGGMNDLIRPALYQAHHKIENLMSSGPVESYMVVGPICESADVFDRDVDLPATHRGDLLSVRTAGAYGMSMASRYNLQNLPGAVYSDRL